MTEQNKEQELEIGVDQLQKIMGESDNLPAFEPIEIGMEDFDMVEFQKGVHETSYLAGVITALFNSGVSENFVLDYLLNKETIKHNLETARINSSMNIEMAKNQRLQIEKNEL